jgi:hypothetical protein
MNWQDFAAIALVAAAASYIAWRAWRVITRKKAGGCGGCSACPTDDGGRQLVELRGSASLLPKKTHHTPGGGAE